MGHANYSNLCDLWVNLLYAKATLTIGQAVDVARKRGEELQASEGGYDADSGMVGVALSEYVWWLQGEKKWWREGGSWEGPYVEETLKPEFGMPKGFDPSGELDKLLLRCRALPADSTVHAACADRILEAGPYQAWSDFVRDLPRVRNAHRVWRNDNGAEQEDDTWEYVDRIPFRFCTGWRRRYREVPKMSHVTH